MKDLSGGVARADSSDLRALAIEAFSATVVRILNTALITVVVVVVARWLGVDL